MIGFHAVAADRAAVVVEERQSDVPLADARGGIAFGAEHSRQREPPGRNERRAANSLEDHAASRDAEGHLPGHQAVARGRANGSWAVGIGEPHALAREAIKVGRGDFGPVVVAAYVAVAKVIGKDDDDVRHGWLFCGVQRRRE
jgi:hypothetical protein